MPHELIGSLGVLILLLAFALNLLNKLTEKSIAYLTMNFIGALMAAWYAYTGKIIPFVILEIVWAITALVNLILVIKKRLLDVKEP